MKRQNFLFITAVLLVTISSCSPYKNAATTPDDVYYSPGQPVVTTTKGANNSDYYSTPNDNYVKMRVQDPDKWAYFDDYNYDYYGSPAYGYGSSISMGFGFGSMPYYGGFGYYSPMSFYNSYYAWNNFYNPYYGGIIVVNGKNTTTPSYTRMSNFNPSAYKGSYYNSRPSGSSLNNINAARNSQNYYNTHQNNTNSNFSRPSFSPSTRSSFSSGGGGGGAMRGGGFSRPGR